MNRTLMCRDAHPGSRVGVATYIRSIGEHGRISYHRIGVGRRANKLGAKAQHVTRLAYAICTISPDAAAEILTLPPRQVGRIIKAVLRRARKTAHKRVSLRRHLNRSVLRIPVSDSTHGRSQSV